MKYEDFNFYIANDRYGYKTNHEYIAIAIKKDTGFCNENEIKIYDIIRDISDGGDCESNYAINWLYDNADNVNMFLETGERPAHAFSFLFNLINANIFIPKEE